MAFVELSEYPCKFKDYNLMLRKLKVYCIYHFKKVNLELESIIIDDVTIEWVNSNSFIINGWVNTVHKMKDN